METALKMKLELGLTWLRRVQAAGSKYRAFYACWSIIPRPQMSVVLLRGMAMTQYFP